MEYIIVLIHFHVERKNKNTNSCSSMVRAEVKTNSRSGEGMETATTQPGLRLQLPRLPRPGCARAPPLSAFAKEENTSEPPAAAQLRTFPQGFWGRKPHFALPGASEYSLVFSWCQGRCERAVDVQVGIPVR